MLYEFDILNQLMMANGVFRTQYGGNPFFYYPKRILKRKWLEGSGEDAYSDYTIRYTFDENLHTVLSEDITVNNSDVYCPPPYTEEGEYRYQYHYLYIDE